MVKIGPGRTRDNDQPLQEKIYCGINDFYIKIFYSMLEGDSKLSQDRLKERIKVIMQNFIIT